MTFEKPTVNNIMTDTTSLSKIFPANLSQNLIDASFIRKFKTHFNINENTVKLPDLIKLANHNLRLQNEYLTFRFIPSTGKIQININTIIGTKTIDGQNIIYLGDEKYAINKTGYKLGFTDYQGQITIYRSSIPNHISLLQEQFGLTISSTELEHGIVYNELGHTVFNSILPKVLSARNPGLYNQLSEAYSLYYEAENAVGPNQQISVIISIFGQDNPNYQLAKNIFTDKIFQAIEKSKLPPMNGREQPIDYFKRILIYKQNVSDFNNVLTEIENEIIKGVNYMKTL